MVKSKKLKFEYGKRFIIKDTGEVVTMKYLCTINRPDLKEQRVGFHSKKKEYLVDEIEEYVAPEPLFVENFPPLLHQYEP